VSEKQQALSCLDFMPDFWREKRERDGGTDWKERQTEQREIETVNHTPCQWNEVNWHKETENERATEGERGREMEKDEWEGITNEWIFNSSQISHTRSTSTNKYLASIISTSFDKIATVCFFFFPSSMILNQSANMTVYLTPDRKGDTLTTRQAGTARLLGKHSLACHSHHVHTASWLPQVSAFTHEEHLNFKLLQKHVSALAHLSVTLQRPDNSTSPN